MFPHVAAQKRCLAEAQRVDAVFGFGDGKGAISVLDQPAPASAELTSACGRKLGLELVNRAEAVVYRGLQLGRHGGCTRPHHVPELVVVPQLRDVVEDAVLRHGRGIVGAGDDLFQRFAGPLRALNRLVAIGDISVVVQVVVIFHCLGGHAVGGKCVVGIGKVWKFKGHVSVPLSGVGVLT